MDYRERGCHARGVYPTQDTLRMGTARAKQEEAPVQGSHWYTQSVVATGGVYKGEEADTRIIVK